MSGVFKENYGNRKNNLLPVLPSDVMFKYSGWKVGVFYFVFKVFDS